MRTIVNIWNSGQTRFFQSKWVFCFKPLLIAFFLIFVQKANGTTLRDYASVLCLSSPNVTAINEKGQEVTTERGWNITIVTYSSALPQIKETSGLWLLSQNNLVVFRIPVGVEGRVPVISVSPDLEAILPTSNRSSIVFEAMMDDFLNTNFCSSIIAGLEALLEDKILISSVTFSDSYPIKGTSEPEWAIGDQNDLENITSFPVCYKREDMIKLTPVFSYVGQLMPGTIKIKAEAGDQEYIVNGDSPAGNIIRPLNNEFIQINAGDAVDYWKDYEISWSLSFNGGQSWEDIGSTKNTIFITWDEPAPPPELEILPGGEISNEIVGYCLEEILYYGCNRAKELSGNNDQDVIDKVWQPFKDKNLNIGLFNPEKGYDLLTYYKNPFPAKTDISIVTDELLGYDGECGAFESIFRMALLHQGILCNYESLGGVNIDEEFLIKIWNIPDVGANPDYYYPYLNEVNIKTVTGEHTYIDETTWELVTITGPVNQPDVRRPNHIYEWIGSPEVTDDPAGNPGQGGIINPYSDFGSHYVTYVNGKIYDPSYGEVYQNIKDWEEKSIDAFYRFVKVESSTGERYVYEIRKNTSQDEITAE